MGKATETKILEVTGDIYLAQGKRLQDIKAVFQQDEGLFC